MNRRKNVTSGYVKVPEVEAPLTHTKEGGQSFFLLGFGPKAECCVDCFCVAFPANVEFTGEVPRPTSKVVWGYKIDGEFHELESGWEVTTCLFLGSTGLSLWNDDDGEYWCPTPKDLTLEGRMLYDYVKAMHSKVVLVSVLDT